MMKTIAVSHKQQQHEGVPRHHGLDPHHRTTDSAHVAAALGRPPLALSLVRRSREIGGENRSGLGLGLACGWPLTGILFKLR
jgi:hypothetical protein